MRTLASLIVLFGLTLSLAGCGGDSGCGSLSGGGGGTTPTGTGNCSSSSTTPPPASNVASLAVSSSAASVPTDGSATATITVLAKDANNNAMSGVAVTLSATSGTLSGAAASTGSNGTVTATLSGQGLSAGTTITVTATSGTVTGKTTVAVVAKQQTITLLTSSPQMPSANTKSVTITAIVQGSNNELLSGVPVTFQASSGAIVAAQTAAGATGQVPAGTTDANGTAQATLTTPGDPTNRFITVTANAGSTSATVQVSVYGTALSISGPTSLVQSAQGSYSVSLTDSGGNAIASQTVTLTSANNNTLTPATVTTSAAGLAQFTLTAVNSGDDTVTATWQGQSSTQPVSVSNQNFSITAPVNSTPTTPTNVVVGQSTPVTISWAASGAPVSSGTVALTTSRGTLSAASVAVSNGALSTPVTISSTTAGPAIISATAIDGSGKTVATAQVVIYFIATVPNSVSVQASPSAVAIKGQSTLTATVIDAANNPVQGATVDFTLTDSTGGSLSAPTAVTNAQGVASIIYTASTGSSAPNGVVVTAQVQGTSISSTTTLTVGGQTVHLSFGTGNLISPYSTTQYSMPYTVQAADAANNGVSNVTVTFSLQAVAYAPGKMLWNATDKLYEADYTTGGFCTPTTVNEYNGVINPSPPPTGVTPVATQIPGAVATTDVGSATTGTGGSATVNLIYPKDHAYWVAVALTATATVAGTQNSATATFVLPGLAADYGTQGTSPPGAVSPYGISATCY